MDEVFALLEAHGATVHGEPDIRTGDPYAGISRYFFLRITDPAGQQRHITGMHAFPSEQAEDGWTRLSLGGDTVSYDLMLSIARSEGGFLFDGRTIGAKRVDRKFELEYAPAFG
ncbi:MULTISPECIES: hypothetical protein [unclassified Bradyrhizobium]